MELSYEMAQMPSTLEEAIKIIRQQAEFIQYFLQHIAVQNERIKTFEERIKDLERRLNLDSNNSQQFPVKSDKKTCDKTGKEVVFSGYDL